MDEILKMTLERIAKQLDDQNNLLQDLRINTAAAETRAEEYENQIEMLGQRFSALETRLETKPGGLGIFKDWKVIGIAAALIMSIGSTIFNGATDPEQSAAETSKQVSAQIQRMMGLLIQPIPTGGTPNANQTTPNDGTTGQP